MQKSWRRRLCAFTDRRFRQPLSSKKAHQRFSPVKALAGRYSLLLDPGKEKETGGRKRLGPRGMGYRDTYAASESAGRTCLREVKKKRRCIACTRICGRNAGSWKESTIEIRRTPLLLRPSVSSKALHVPKILFRARKNWKCRPLHCLTETACTALRAFTWRQRMRAFERMSGRKSQ